MSSSGFGHKAWAALLILAAWSARADEAPRASTPTATPLKISPTPANDADYAPTGAMKPSALPVSAPLRLDLSLPPELRTALPPEAPPPTFEPVSAVPAATEPTGFDPTAPTPAVSPTPAATPSEATPASAAPAAATLADEIHAALDRLVAAPAKGRPIGAGDWGAARKAIAAVYAERGYAPLWLDGDHWSDRARAALARLAKADEDGLDLTAAPAPPAEASDPALRAQAEEDVALSAAVVAYALQASGARINPRALAADIGAKPEVADPGFALRSVADAADPDAALAAFNPPQEGYRALRAALARMRGDAPAAAMRFTPGPVLRLGMSDPRVALIRARFGLGGLPDPSASEVYDVRVASAVAAFQRVHGLPANGALTEATATALDGVTSNARRERLLVANMEMWRWQPRAMGDLRVEVNVADFSLRLYRGDSVIFHTRVIVGKPDTPTPIFSNSIKYMLFNPVWHVPDSIVKKEMEPRLNADPGYFERHGYNVTYVGDKMVVEQPPGEANALGRMLFLFPNEYSVYLHDTPTRSLFGAPYRALSHGCVRVEEPARLAEILMGGAARGWTDSRVHSLLGDKERTVALLAPVPVHLQYFTEFVDESGALRERSDLYDLTRKVVSALTVLHRD